MRAILFIDRSVLYFAGGSAKAPLSLPFPPTVIQDMEVIDEVALTKLITDLITTQKLKPSPLLICVSSTSYFQKDIPEKTEELQLKKITDEFDDNVPFNKVLSKVFVQAATSKIIGINRDMVYVLKKAFETHGFQVESIVPTFALYGDQAVTFNAEVAEQFLKHFNSLQQVSFPIVTDDLSQLEIDDKEFSGEKKKPENRQTLLIGVFVFLLLVLVLVYMIFKQKRSQPISQVQPTVAATQTVTTAPVVSPTDTPTIAPEIPKDQIIIQVLNGSGNPGEADRVKARLEEASFTNIITGNAPTQVSENTLIVVKPRVSRAYRDEISTMIKSLGLDLSLKENAEIEYDVLITTYQQP